MKIKNSIERKLYDSFDPEYLEVINESNNHNVPRGSESHFKVVIVTDRFEGQRLIQRHRSINSALADELTNHIHALALHTYTPQEWFEYYSELPPNSPKCLGGSTKASI
ncbi:BolA family protein [Flocculibacter collagenilyticus]|uniref:BolA family protein n=1 Tax=Flocculibacter collagenilyticus TaxID=2744479 RepID=UPI0018F335CA|nr:BolA/IbaG family iron-sulfur metabolism protein [Flocculibacter collagenilyticus]